MDADRVQVIKQMIAFRAKYRVGTGKKRYCPGLVVPHPKNRGGVPLAPKRNRELGGIIVHAGYDSVEANTNGVLVQARPESKGGSKDDFQKDFSAKIAADRDVAEYGVEGMRAVFGSLSHSHLNCVLRNILAGTRGCECIDLTVVGKKTDFKCTCKAKRILDENGNYSMALLAGHDRDWHIDVLGGLEWEELAWQMDVEEPEASQIISLALNKKRCFNGHRSPRSR